MAVAHLPNGKPVLLGADGKPINLDPVTGRPDGSAQPIGISLPHALTFVARHGGAAHTYWHERHDEAMRHAREDAEVMRRDAYLMSLMQERQLAVSGLNWHLEVPDNKDAYQAHVRDGLKRIIDGIPHLRRIISWLLEAVWYGRYGVQVQWHWSHFTSYPVEKKQTLSLPGAPTRKQTGQKKRCLTIKQAWPVNGDKIGFQYDHTPYILMAGDKADDYERDLKASTIMTTAGRGLSLRGTWRERFLLHRHLMEDVDFFSPDQAAAVHGVGVRSKLFWLNWLKLEWLGNVTDFFDRIGLGVTLWKYPAGNEQAKAQAEEAARNQSGKAHVLVPVWGESGREALTGVERVEIPTSGADALVKLIDYIDRQIERYVVGQEGSSRANAQGIGNEAASAFMASTKEAIVRHDANLLAISLTGSPGEPGLVDSIKRWTFPEADFPVKWVFDVERTESDKKLTAAKTLIELGLKVKADELRAAGGFSKPSDGDELAEPPQQGMPGMPGMPGMGGGMPGMPGAGGPGGETGGASGAVNSPGAGAPPTPPGAAPGGSPEQQDHGGGGDFLEALRAARQDQPERYDWQNKGFVRMSPTGVPLYRWYNPDMRQARIQNVRPGQGLHAGPPKARARGGTAGGRSQGPQLDVGPRTLELIARVLALMFPGGWVKPSGLPALVGAEATDAVNAFPRREADGTVVLELRHPGGEAALRLAPAGKLSFSGSGSPHALAVAGVDSVPGDMGEALAEETDRLERAVQAGNGRRRRFRRDHASEQMDKADEFLPRPEVPAEAPAPEAPTSAKGDTSARRVNEVIRHLRETGKDDLARRVALRYATRRMGGD